ncbi:sigma-70 family RNA polymerase sigma factor [Luteimonas yindakuii]|uniref:Sigma-70 family RNA polymerase sigma factor n=1 Tax=Luteimonas yindakuii TaxID=2565782 RepID=A0A4Z1R4L7_9GAMM|nr:sigma-70 family RNA polymerase sigma factor [Luteimonas yindakuii]TKS53485.1 sigma-70 family RNA polymerase sigma factor [Luteimonas yindakuii]
MEIASPVGTDADGFEVLLARHRGIVLKVAASYAWHREDRAELAQEIHLQLWRAWPGYDRRRSFPTWMYRIALNVAIDHARRQGGQRDRTEPFDDRLHDVAAPGPDPALQEQLRLLQDFIRTRAPFERALLLLHLEERSTREIAEVLGIGESNVTTRISRLKQRLRDHARIHCPEADHGTR